MKLKFSGKRGAARQKSSGKKVPSRRLRPEDRRSDFIQKAISFFAERGFEGGTRDLAVHLNVTQPLLYRYFPTKEDLINAVYQTVYLDVWKMSWDDILIDRQCSLEDRLLQFYTEYTDAIMNEHWMRIYFFAALRGAEINQLYIKFIEERILRRISHEFLLEHGVNPKDVPESHAMAYAWNLQSAIFYYGVRRFVYKMQSEVSKEHTIRTAVGMFIAGFREGLVQRGLIKASKPSSDKSRNDRRGSERLSKKDRSKEAG